MAEINGSGSIGNDKYWLHSWTGLGNGDTGKPVRVSHLADKTVMLDGTFGSGGSVDIEGSMDNSTWEVLTDPQGNAITLTTATVEAISENTRFIRPNVTAGDGTTSLNVRIGASASK